MYVQRLVLFDRGLAQAEQSVYRQLRAQEEVALAEAAERATAHALAFCASGLASLQETLRGRNDGDRPFDPVQDKPWSACFRL